MLLGNKKIFYLIAISIFKTSSLSWACSSDDALTAMKFKIGFEFQEASHLCQWALTMPEIQKKKLFAVNNSAGQPLWHVEIDGEDIEFVTVPFTGEELANLEICIDSIIKAVGDLQSLLLSSKETSFKLWVELIGKAFSLNCDFPDYTLIANSPLKISRTSWQPKFVPQVTIQHPLEYAIPLYFGLFGFTRPDLSSPTMAKFLASLPFYNLLTQDKEGICQGLPMDTYTTEKCGLAFLYALSLVYMTPYNSATPDGEYSDTDFLNATLRFLKEDNQVDAKANLIVMSRRPFSQMFKEVQQKADYDFYNDFIQNCATNDIFQHFYKVPTRFNTTNFAEQFDTPLEKILNMFQEDFVTKNEALIIELLKQGVISTAMIRNLKPEIKVIGQEYSVASLLEKFYERSIASVVTPNERYDFDTKMKGVKRSDYQCDTFSPPWFLSLSDSMGGYKEEEDSTDKKPKINKEYGGAIVEVRGIASVGSWFIEKFSPNSRSSRFLMYLDHRLQEEVRGLFTFLRDFITNDYRREVYTGVIPAVWQNFNMGKDDG